jgi:hypothetical protein
MDRGEAKRVGQFVLGEWTLLALVRRQTDDLQALPELDQKMADAFQRILSAEVD